MLCSARHELAYSSQLLFGFSMRCLLQYHRAMGYKNKVCALYTDITFESESDACSNSELLFQLRTSVPTRKVNPNLTDWILTAHSLSCIFTTMCSCFTYHREVHSYRIDCDLASQLKNGVITWKKLLTNFSTFNSVKSADEILTGHQMEQKCTGLYLCLYRRKFSKILQWRSKIPRRLFALQAYENASL